MNQKAKILTLPNLITLARIPLIPLFLYFLKTSQSLLALLSFFLFYFGDALDGYLARKLKEETELGMLLDPLADSAFVFSSYISFYLLKRINLLFLLLLTLPRAINGLIFVLTRKKFKPSILRKTTGSLILIPIPLITFNLTQSLLLTLLILPYCLAVSLDHLLLIFTNHDSDALFKKRPKPQPTP
jgi:cardiolipin synthase